MNTNKSPSVLLIGGKATGKTHYITQLYGRLRARTGQFQIQKWKSPPSIAVVDGALNKLNQGLAADHTPTSQYEEIILPLTSSKGGVDLVWPDYGGEQIELMLRQRRVSMIWRSRIEAADAWLFFVRPDQMDNYRDMLSHPVDKPAAEINSSHSSEKEQAGIPWPSQAGLIELLQLLLFIKGINTIQRTRCPILVLVLSCWDKLPQGQQEMHPDALLNYRLPLLAAFINSTWHNEYRTILGLSSTERTLDQKEPDQGYIDQGPEQFGYIVQPDGSRSNDLTLLLKALVKRLS